MAAELAKHPVSGVFLLDKLEGPSSNTVLQKAYRLYNVEGVGYTSVLNPLTTGLLPVCFGEMTKFAQYPLDADKAYTVTLKLGEASSMGDAEDEIIATAHAGISLAEFQTACQALTGNVCQVPPMSLAFRHEGKPLYEYACKGVVIERKPRDTAIYTIDITGFDAPKAVVDARYSKGTYIRTLSEDVAGHIGMFAHLTVLRRIETASFTIHGSYTLETLTILDETEHNALLLSCDVLAQHLPKVEPNDRAITMLKCSQHPQSTEGISTDQPIRVYDHSDTSIGLAGYQEEIGRLKTLRLTDAGNGKRLQ